MTFHDALGPLEVTVLVVAIIGAVPIAFHYRKRSKYFVAAYALIFVGAMSTNVENLILGDTFNLLEHSVGLMGASIAFAAAAYLRRQNVLLADNDDSDPMTDDEPGGA